MCYQMPVSKSFCCIAYLPSVVNVSGGRSSRQVLGVWIWLLHCAWRDHAWDERSTGTATCASQCKPAMFVHFFWWWIFSCLQEFGGECSSILSPPVLFLLLHTLIPLFRQGSIHSGSASWDDCGRVFPDELHMSSFTDRFPHYTWTVA